MRQFSNRTLAVMALIAAASISLAVFDPPKPTARPVVRTVACPALLHHDQQLQRDLQVMSRGFTLARQDWHRGFRYVMPRFAAVPRTPPTCGETR